MINNIKEMTVSLFKRLLKSRIFVSSSLISIVSVLIGFVNFLFQLIVGRLLGEKQYGIVGPLVDFSSIISIPAAAIQFIISKDISLMIHQKDWQTLKSYLRKSFSVLIMITVLMTVISLLLLPILKSYFHIGNNEPFLMVFAMVALALIVIPFNCLIQARERFNIYVINSIISVSAKFIFGIGLVVITVNYMGIFYGLLISQIAAIIYLGMDFINFKEMQKLSRTLIDKKYFNIKKIVKSFFYAIISIGAFQFITYLDTVLVRHFIPDSSGVYAMAAKIGKASLYIAMALSFVMLPIMAKDNENINKINKRAFVFLAVLLLGYAVLLIFASNFISVYLFGNKFPGMEKILPLYGFMFIPYSAIIYLVNYYVITEKLVYSITILTGALLQYFGIYFFHGSLFQVCLVVGITGYVILFALISRLGFFLFSRKV